MTKVQTNSLYGRIGEPMTELPKEKKDEPSGWRAVEPQPTEGNYVAASDQIWVCQACGKTARSRYGFWDDGTKRGGASNADNGWDASCMSNAVLCYQPWYFIRASGDCVCSCGREYRKHKHDPTQLGPPDHNGVPQPFLRVLCDGTRVKL